VNLSSTRSRSLRDWTLARPRKVISIQSNRARFSIKKSRKTRVTVKIFEVHRLSAAGFKVKLHPISDSCRRKNKRLRLWSKHAVTENPRWFFCRHTWHQDRYARFVTVQKTPLFWVRERTIPTERPPLVGELSANFWSAWRIPTAVFSDF
jgi:hypothetical protein